MGAKQIAYANEAREAIKRGVETLAKAVKVTLGPRGRNVMIEAGPWTGPTVTKDGVTVANSIELQEPFADIGAQLVKEVASKTSDGAGDGTTTATVLAEAIFNHGLQALVSGVKPVQLKRGIEKARGVVVGKLADFRRDVSGVDQIAQVGAIAANNDAEIGKVLAECLDKVGKDGVISVDEGQTLDTTTEFVDGLGLDRGYLSPYFVTNPDDLSCELEDPYVLLYDGKIAAVRDLVPVLEQVVNSRRPLLVIAEGVEGEALALLVVNSMRGGLKACAVKTPGFGEQTKDHLMDLAVLLGGKVISKDTGFSLETTAVEHLGQCKKAIIRKDDTTLVDGAGTQEEIKARQVQIEAQAQATSSEPERDRIRERGAKLAGGVARVLVGGATETEVKEKKARVEDALHAVRAAAEEGIVPGGGVALLRASLAVAELEETLDAEERIGARIVRQALHEPMRQIVANAGLNPGVVVAKVLENDEPNFGFNAQTFEYGDLIAQGVIDPTKVARTAFENAVSVATLLLTTETLIGEPKPDDPDDIE